MSRCVVCVVGTVVLAKDVTATSSCTARYERHTLYCYRCSPRALLCAEALEWGDTNLSRWRSLGSDCMELHGAAWSMGALSSSTNWLCFVGRTWQEASTFTRTG